MLSLFLYGIKPSCTSQDHALCSSPGLPHSPQTSTPLADPYSPFTYICISYAGMRPPSAEWLVKLRAKPQQKLSSSSVEREPAVRDGKRRMQGWMTVHLRNQCNHLQLLRSCSPRRKQSAASKAKAVGVTPPGQGKNILWKLWRCGQRRGSTGGEWQKRTSTKEIPQHLQFQCKRRWQMLSQAFTALLLLGNILSVGRKS